jgi:hypothetical protein
MISSRPAIGLCQQRVPAIAVADAVPLQPDLFVPGAGKWFGANHFGAVHHDAYVFTRPPPAAGARQRDPVAEVVEVARPVAGQTEPVQGVVVGDPCRFLLPVPARWHGSVVGQRGTYGCAESAGEAAVQCGADALVQYDTERNAIVECLQRRQFGPRLFVLALSGGGQFWVGVVESGAEGAAQLGGDPGQITGQGRCSSRVRIADPCVELVEGGQARDKRDRLDGRVDPYELWSRAGDPRVDRRQAALGGARNAASARPAITRMRQ